MNAWIPWIVAAAAVGHFVLVITLARVIVRLTIGRRLARYPAAPPAPGAVSRAFQSMRIGPVSLAWSVHIAVDDEHLHLRPARLARLIGVRAASVPWSDVVARGSAGRWMAVVSIAGLRVAGPTWCLALADQPRQRS